MRSASVKKNRASNQKICFGNTLFSLAKQHKMTVDNLRLLNNLKNSTLKVGTQLRVSGTAERG